MKFRYLLDELSSAASFILNQRKRNESIALHGAMGSGKTTLIRAIGELLNLKDEVSSPTYSIINEYRTEDDDLIVHMDWYRLKSVNEAIESGVQDYLDSAFCIIEWPNRLPELLPKNCLQFQIEIDGEGRIISVLPESH